MKEIRAFEFDVKAENNEEHGHYLAGTPIVFEEPTILSNRRIGEYREIIDRNALAEADLRDVRFLINHNTDMIPLARSRNNNENSTMQMSVNENGMDIRVDLDTENNVEAKSLYSAVERGDITGMSFMFTVDKDTWTEERDDIPERRILSIGSILEVSAVTFPAYNQTSLSVRGLSEALDSAAESLESARAEKKAVEDHKKRIAILLEM